MSYSTQLATEAVAVGGLLVPMYLLTEHFIKNKMASLFVSGVAFHLICEVTGLNKWYLTHGASSM